jgi:hypothetical protein
MLVRLSKLFNGTPESWLTRQAHYDLPHLFTRQALNVTQRRVADLRVGHTTDRGKMRWQETVFSKMHIDHDNLTIANESDVEQKIIMPLLSGPAYLDIPQNCIFTKSYLAPSVLDKSAEKTTGYYPDYSVWMHGFPILIVEAKAPDVSSEAGYREASLYARHLNQNYATDLNPCRFIVSTNGHELFFGHWDSSPILELSVTDLRPGSAEFAKLAESCHSKVLNTYALGCVVRARASRSYYPYLLADGPALLTARRAPNSFAAELSPLLRRYFFSSNQENTKEIIERAYVSTSEITEYDRILESLLKERLYTRTGALAQQLEPDRHGEEHVRRAIEEYSRIRPESGQLQIIQGSVGSGKSLFARRYKELLQPKEHSERCRWSFIDFNSSPADLSHAEEWLCKSFIEGFERENPTLDLSSKGVLRGVLSRNIQKRRVIYDDLEKKAPDQAAVLKATDLAKWQDDASEMTEGLANYVLGIRKDSLVVVLDNVDRLELKNQLDAFQLALWFMHKTRAFVILQMRDETYERYKNQPPLDTFRTGITFHITPPRFLDVVKKRLELSLEYLETEAKNQQSYAIESGVRITYHKSDLQAFLRGLYVELFDRKRNISRVLESLVGRDVRRALEMFVSIIMSGRLSPTAITSAAIGGGGIAITERQIIKILMRTEYSFFSDHSGFVTNIFGYDPDWEKPDNFLLIEILYTLQRNRKRIGQIGLEGYFTCRSLAQDLQKFGYTPVDTLKALNLLLRRQLIAADHMNFRQVELDDCVRILASGFIHLRILSGRIEYLYGILPTTPLTDKRVADRLADMVRNESLRGGVSSFQTLTAVETFYQYLVDEDKFLSNIFLQNSETGRAYVLNKIEEGIEHFKNSGTKFSSGPDELDL